MMTELYEDTSASETVPLTSVFSTDCVKTLGAGTTKTTALWHLVEMLAATGKLPQTEVENVVDELVEREKMGTTGMGKGIAIPHLRTNAVCQCAGAIGMVPEGIDFKSLDGLPTRLVFLLLSPPQHREHHIHILRRLARLFCDRTVQYRVRIPRTPEDLFTFLGFD
jgi:mannitol/fructose-specific phosphotransferase system IIA component (Ntr-type)